MSLIQSDIYTNHDGEIKSIGEFGPVYEVVKASSDDQVVRIRLVETGEETDYPYLQMLTDPQAI